MADTIPVLWPDDISVDIVTPLAILRRQEEPLRGMTGGLLEAEVTTQTTDSGVVQHQLDLIAPALHDYRHRILTVTHDRDVVYPVRLAAECYAPGGTDYEPTLDEDGDPVENEDWRAEADTQDEFIDLVGKVFRSREVRSVIHSLIARSNEQRNIPTPLPTARRRKKSE